MTLPLYTSRYADGMLTVSLPIPDRAVSPNAQRGQSRWAAIAKSKIVKQHRNRARFALEAAIEQHGLGKVEWSGYSLKFYFATKAFRDDDNADGSCKAYRDGCAEALKVDDKTFRKVALSTHAKDAECPRVEITLHQKQTEVHEHQLRQNG
jgi:hypothetical protein